MNVRLMGMVTVAVALTMGGAAHADIPTTVQKKLRGKVLLTVDALPDDVGDKKTLSKFKELDQNELTHQMVDGVPAWSFHYTAFLKRAPKASALSVDFHTASGKKRFVANKGLVGVDPKLKVLSGELTMSEDDNLNKGKTYYVEVTVKVGRRHVVLAKTKVSLK